MNMRGMGGGMVGMNPGRIPVADPIATRQAFTPTFTSPNNPMGGRLASPSTFKKGGKVKKTGWAKVHKGEKVIPAKKKHPGFKKVQSKIAKKYGMGAAGAILASATRKASAKAKKNNPRLKKVKVKK